MKESENHKTNPDWTIYRSNRIAVIIPSIISVLVVNLVKIGEFNRLFTRLNEGYFQEYFVFLALSVIFYFFFTRQQFNNWLLFYGISLSTIGVAHFTIISSIWIFDSFENLTTFVYGILLLIPCITPLVLTFAIWRWQKFDLVQNTRLDRIVGTSGILLSLVLMIAEFFPWITEIYDSTSRDWKFKGSGTGYYVRNCCYISDVGIASTIYIYAPLIGLAFLWLIAALGYKLNFISFIPSIVWCLQETIDFVTSLGNQEPSTVWTYEQVEKYGLSLRVEGLVGGYLFILGFIFQIIILMIPRVIEGPSTNQIIRFRR